MKRKVRNWLIAGGFIFIFSLPFLYIAIMIVWAIASLNGWFAKEGTYDMPSVGWNLFELENPRLCLSSDIDSCFFDNSTDSVIFPTSPANLWQTRDTLVKDVYAKTYLSWPCVKVKIPVHRTDGHVDTLISLVACEPSGKRTPFRERINIGYVQRYSFEKNWLIVEVKNPGDILGISHLRPGRKVDGMPVKEYPLCWYDFKGQRKIFDSEKSYYWIVSRTKTDLYGPLKYENLLEFIEMLHIPTPIELKSWRDQYEDEFGLALEKDFPEGSGYKRKSKIIKL